MPWTRRSFLTKTGAGAGTVWIGLTSPLDAQTYPQSDSSDASEIDPFPQQDPKLVQEVVGASHGRMERVKELVTAYPELAKSAWDWGFGDWETPIDAASHVGNRDIAEFLMEHGARPTLFTFAMFGELNVVKAMLAFEPELRKMRGPHGLTLYHHASVGGEKANAVREHLESLGDSKSEAGPIAKETIDSLLGKYQAIGPDGAKFEILTNRFGLALQGSRGGPRNLTHLPDGSFHPAGAVSVRLRFEITDGKASGATLKMGDRVYQASRLP